MKFCADVSLTNDFIACISHLSLSFSLSLFPGCDYRRLVKRGKINHDERSVSTVINFHDGRRDKNTHTIHTKTEATTTNNNDNNGDLLDKENVGVPIFFFN